MSITREIACGSITLRTDGVLHSVFDLQSAPTAADAKEYAHARNELIGSKSVPVVVELLALPYIDREVRAFFMEGLSSGPACRAVVTTDTTHRLLFESFEMMDPFGTPTQIFPNVESALVWTHSFSEDRA